MPISVDAAIAIKNAWVGSVAALVPVTRLYIDDELPGSPELPYVTATIVQHQEPVYPIPRFSGVPFQDWRAVAFRAYHTTKVNAGMVLDAIFSSLTTLTVPNSVVLDWEPNGAGDVVADGQRDGVTVYAASVEFILWTQRESP